MNVILSNSLAANIKYLWLKNSTYYYRRRYPADISAIKGSKVKFICLNTSDPISAAKEAFKLSSFDQAEWERLRNPDQTIPSNNQTHRSAQLVSMLEQLKAASKHDSTPPVLLNRLWAGQSQMPLKVMAKDFQ